MRKVALITGSSRGIGRAAAARLARDGYAVCINYIEREDKAEELLRELRAEGCDAITYQADVADADAVRAMAAACEKTFGPITLLVNNAGVAGQSLFQDVSDDMWNRYFAVNIGGMRHTHKVPTRQTLGQGEGYAHLSVLVRTQLRIEEGRLIEVLAHRHSDGLLRFGLCAFFVIRLQCDLTQYGAIR